MASQLVVRALHTDEENERHFQMADQAFSQQPSPENARLWQMYVTHLPNFQPGQIRGAFLDDKHVGGYICYERLMKMGPAQISTGCIGAVVTYPEYRHQGVGTALLQDALHFAQERGHQVLLLDGIANFYHRYGYIDVIDLSVLTVNRSAVQALAPGSYTTRRATVDDAQAVLALYQRHYHSYTGSFVRSPAYQEFLLRYNRQPVVALSPEGELQGYLSLTDDGMGQELAADNWEALKALLQYHLAFPTNTDESSLLRYRLPLNSSASFLLGEHLVVPDAAQWHHPAEGWSVRAELYEHRNAGWMARLVKVSTVMQSILPVLQERWHRSLAQWTGTLNFVVADEQCSVHLRGSQVAVETEITASGYMITCSPQSLIQLVFGYRPANWILRSSLAGLPEEILEVITLLFPSGHAWIVRSDWF